MKTCMLIVVLLIWSGSASAQQFEIPRKDGGAVPEVAITGLFDKVIASRESGEVEFPDASFAHLQIATGRHADAMGTIHAIVRGLVDAGEARRADRWMPYLVYAQAKAMESGSGIPFDTAYGRAFRERFGNTDDLAANHAQYWFTADLDRARADLDGALKEHASIRSVSLPDALELARQYAFVEAHEAATRLGPALIAEDEQARYIVEENHVFTTAQGATLSAVVVRARKQPERKPVALLFTIYTDLGQHLQQAKQAAARGYVGVVVDARGKRLSTDRIVPYEHEVDDANAAVDWASRQPWSNGEVGMYGGSYSGFAAWAAAKRGHRALKTIVPYVAAIPGQGLPMENNIFLSANYGWAFFVANNRFLDSDTYSQRERWKTLDEKWFKSGRPYREIDRVDGTPNPLLQRWLLHPAYDAYWQAMVPYREDFSRIDIPVLSITGYYDDGQISALHYFKEHYRYKPDAEHYLLIGPYDHFGAQAPFKTPVLNGYRIDPVAQFDTVDVTFQWLDYVMRGGARPELLKGRVNYEVMGANEWRNAPSLAAAGGGSIDFYLSDALAGGHRLLSKEKPASIAMLAQQVDFADRMTFSHGYYPDPIVRDSLPVESGLSFISAPFDHPVTISGTFSGELKARINKRDFDFAVVLYEMMADGRVMQLSYYLGRASFARDMGTRVLLEPGEWTSIPFERTRMVSRRLEKGSRLLAVLDVVKDPMHQVNYGTGRDVSDESIADAVIPLDIEWRTDSYLRIPLSVERPD